MELENHELSKMTPAEASINRDIISHDIEFMLRFSGLPEAYIIYLKQLWSGVVVEACQKFISGQLKYGGNFFDVEGPINLRQELIDGMHYNSILEYNYLKDHPSLAIYNNPQNDNSTNKDRSAHDNKS